MQRKNGITIEPGGRYAPCCYLVCQVINGDWNKQNERTTILVQTDLDYIGLADTFGMPWREETENQRFQRATDYLNQIAGTGLIVQNPGYVFS